MHADITNSGSCKSSRFELTVSTSRDTPNNRWLDMVSGKVSVEIYVRSQHSGSEIVMFTGLADSIAMDPINGTARLIGRDYSSVLVNSTYQNSFNNQTASEIATYIASRHGFSPNISATSTMVGSFQSDGYSQVLLNTHSRITSEWDLLTQLAKSEGFQLFIDGRTLVFSPAGSLSSNNTSIDVDDVIGLKFVRNCPLSDQTTLTVKSWNSWLGQALHHEDQSSDQAPSSVPDLNADPATEIAIVRPNLTPQGAERLARQRSEALRKQTLTVQIVMPGEVSMKPGDVVAITSGSSSFDANYTISSIRRQFSTSAGFIQHVNGFSIENSSPT